MFYTHMFRLAPIALDKMEGPKNGRAPTSNRAHHPQWKSAQCISLVFRPFIVRIIFGLTPRLQPVSLNKLEFTSRSLGSIYPASTQIIKRMRQISKAAQENPEEANELVARSMYHMLPPSHRASVEEYAVLNDVSGEEVYA